MGFWKDMFGKKEPNARLADVTAVLFFETESDAMGFCHAIPGSVVEKICREADGRGITVAPMNTGRFGVRFCGRFTGDETRDLVSYAKRRNSCQGSQWTIADREVTNYVFPGARS